MSNTSIAAPAICLFFNTLIKACSSTIGPRDALINQAVGFILSSSAAPTRPRVRLLNTKWIVRMSARANSWSLETRIAPAALAASGVMFWLQAIRFIPKALPIRATCDPIRPSPRTPRVFPRRSVPTVCCQPPDRTELLSVTICRAEAKISAQVNSIVGSDLYPVLEIGKALNDVTGQRCSLAHYADHVERHETLDDVVEIGQMIIENGDRGAPGERRPVGHLQRHVLIIVQDGYADHFRHTPCSTGQPDSPTSSRTSLASWMPLSWGIRKPPSVVT